MPMRAAPARLFLDANLLVLFVAGRVSTAIIARHRRLSEYDAADYAALAAGWFGASGGLMGQAGRRVGWRR